MLDKGGDMLSGDADLHGEHGQFVYPDWYPTPLALKAVDLKLHFTSAPQHLVLDQMAIDLGDARLKATGTADFTGPNVAIDAAPISRIFRWPASMRSGRAVWRRADGNG